MKSSNKPKKIIFIAILIGILAFVAGFFFSGDLFLWLLPIKPGLSYIETDVTGPFRIMIGFSVVFALIPILIALIWYFGNIRIPKHKLFIVIIIFLTISTAIIIRREMIKSRAIRPGPVFVVGAPDQEVYVSEIKFEYFMLAGLIAGSILCYFIFKQSENNKQVFEFEKHSS